MKRLIVCCDGTWQSPRANHPTNIIKLLEAIPPIENPGTGPSGEPVSQTLYYDEGVGTRNLPEKIGGGVFGWGLDAAIEKAYTFLCLNWEPGDQIYLFGFSRGAYTVRSLAGLIYNCDLLRRQHILQVPNALRIYRSRSEKDHPAQVVDFRRHFGHPQRDTEPRHAARITALGCFDTVGSMGIPNVVPFLPIEAWLNRRHRFHDTDLSPIVEHAFHALAVDERRRTFLATLMGGRHLPPGRLHEVWFPGKHSGIGGGQQATETLSNIALNWMLDQIAAARLGLVVNRQLVTGGLAENPHVKNGREDFLGRVLELIGPVDREIPSDAEIHPSVWTRIAGAGGAYRPRNLPPRPTLPPALAANS